MAQSDWYKQSAKFLKAELAMAGIGYEELCLRLADIGVEETYQGVAAKVNRGAFSFAFFMQCMKALGVKTVRFGE